MKYLLMVLTILSISSCMKSKDEYQEAITEIQQEQEAEGDREIQRKIYQEQNSQNIQREEAIERNEQRSRGSNDAEGMGMDE